MFRLRKILVLVTFIAGIFLIWYMIWSFYLTRTYTFREFDTADSAIVSLCEKPPHKINTSGQLTQAINAIKQFPSQWAQPLLTPEPANQIMVSFYDDHTYLGNYVIGANFIAYRPLQDQELRWRDIRMISVRERTEILTLLELPDVGYGYCLMEGGIHDQLMVQ